VQLLTAYHPLRASERVVFGDNRGPEQSSYRTRAAPISIGAQVWIGAGTIVMPGVSIGDNVTVGAGSVVTKDVPPNVLALGQPCRVVREL
jgi:maltose O-acetyltransferase